jgi:hypothetical protein
MTPSKLNLLFAFFNYAGNGATASIVPQLRRWWGRTLVTCYMDERFKHRIDQVYDADICDTPITMTRNLAVRYAREAKADVLIMVDSDQVPDVHIRDDGAKLWFDSSLEFFLREFDKGRPVAIGAPYCGPPPHENVYVFQWRNFESDDPDMGHQLGQYDREHAAAMAGMMPVAALPTGLIMFDMRLFDMITAPYFEYEYVDREHTEKASTEDVVSTRDMSLVLESKLGYNPIICNWDAWAGHAKPKIVGKPRPVFSDSISKKLHTAMNGPRSDRRLRFIGDPTEVTSEMQLWATPQNPSSDGAARLKRSAEKSPSHAESQAVPHSPSLQSSPAKNGEAQPT